MEVVTAKPPAGSDLRVLGDDGRPLVLAEGEVASSIKLVAFSLASGTPGRDLLPDFAGAQALDYGGVALAMPRTWIPRRRAIATDRFDPAFAPWFLFQTIAPSCSLAWSLGYYEGTVAEVEARLEWVTALVHGLGEIEERRMLGDPDGLALVLRPEPREGKVPLEVACIRTRTDRRALIDLRVSLGIAADHPRREAYEKAVRKVAWRAIDGLAFVGS